MDVNIGDALMLRSKVSGLRFAGRDQTGEPGFLIVSAWTRGFPENEGIATGGGGGDGAET